MPKQTQVQERPGAIRVEPGKDVLTYTRESEIIDPGLIGRPVFVVTNVSSKMIPGELTHYIVSSQIFRFEEYSRQIKKGTAVTVGELQTRVEAYHYRVCGLVRSCTSKHDLRQAHAELEP